MKCPNCGESQFPFSSPSKCKACAKLFSKCVYCAGLGSLGSRFAQRCSKCQGNGAVPELEPEDEEKLRAARLGAKYETSPAFIDCSICATPIPKLSIKQGMTSVQYALPMRRGSVPYIAQASAHLRSRLSSNPRSEH